jgi:hypothetical protein
MPLKHMRLPVLEIEEQPNCWPSFCKAFPLFNHQLGNRWSTVVRIDVGPPVGSRALFRLLRRHYSSVFARTGSRDLHPLDCGLVGCSFPRSP